jgi:hypothetical protein
VHRDVFAKFRLFDESYRLAMDYEMWLRIGKLSLQLSLMIIWLHLGATLAAQLSPIVYAHLMKTLGLDFIMAH